MERISERKQGSTMSYIENNLLDDEHLIYSAHLHWIVFIKSIFWLLIAVIVYVYMPPFYFHPDGLAPIPVHKIILIIPIFFTLTYGWAAYVRYISSEFGVT